MIIPIATKATTILSQVSIGGSATLAAADGDAAAAAAAAVDAEVDADDGR